MQKNASFCSFRRQGCIIRHAGYGLLNVQNHDKNKDEEIKGMQISINVIQLTTNMPECITFNELKEVTFQDQHLQQLMENIIQGWPDNKDQLPPDIRQLLME